MLLSLVDVAGLHFDAEAHQLHLQLPEHLLGDRAFHHSLTLPYS